MFATKVTESCLKLNRLSKKNYYLVYTLIFAIAAVLVNLIFIRRNLTYVCDVDAFTQHSVALEYYGEWLRDFFRTLFTEHRIEFKNFDFSIGMGADVVKAFNYYAIGDPLNFLSVFVPVRYTAYLYTFLAMVRYYLAGIAFSAYCFERKQNNLYAVLTSSLVYVFSTFGILAGMNHAFFINPMIYMPLMFIAVEKIIKNKNPLYLALIVCVAEISNFYFFYMMVFATIVYVLIRLFTIFGTQIKRMMVPLVKIGLSAIGGVLLGAFIFFPTILTFLSDGRVSAEHTYDLFYDISYYFNFILSMVYINPYNPWTLVGSTALFLYALVALFLRKKKNTGLKIAVFLCLVGFALPAFGGFSNGFSYACNRWSFIFTFVLAFTSTVVWEDLFEKENRIKSIVTLVLPLIYVAGCFVLPQLISSKYKIALVMFAAFTALFFISQFLFKSQNSKKLCQAAVLLLNIACIAVNGYITLGAKASEFYTQQQINEKISPEYTAVSEYTESVGEKDFYRYTADFLEYNDAIRRNGYATQYYWSLSDGYISDFQDSIYLNESFYQYYNGFDDSAVLNSLSSVKYYYDKAGVKGEIPYGFVSTDIENLYINKYVLPLAYTYDSYVTREELNSLATSAEKQQIFMKSAVLEESPSGVDKADIVCKVEKPEYEIVPDSKYITFENNTFTVTRKYASATLLIKTPASGESYLSLRNFNYVSTKTDDLFTDNTDVDPLNLFDEKTLEKYDLKTISDKIGIITPSTEPEIFRIRIDAADNGGNIHSKELKYYTPFYRFYVGKADYDVCLGYTQDGFTKVRIMFGPIGKYSFDSLNLVVQDMGYYTDGVEKLSEDVLENVVVGVDSIKGTVNLDSSKILCFAVPYSDGWVAYVDGEKQHVLKTNIMHTGVEVPEGVHEIELKYTTPEMKSGAVISIFGFILLFVYGMWYHIMKKKERMVTIEVD